MRTPLRRPLLALAIGASLAAATPALAGALTDFAENKGVDALLRGQAIGTPATWHIGLTTDTCTDAGNGTEPVGGAYARFAVTAALTEWAGTQGAGTTVASSGTGGTTSNNNIITFPETTASWGTLQAVRWYDAPTGGNAWICLDLAAPFAATSSGITVRFPAGQLQFQIDN